MKHMGHMEPMKYCAFGSYWCQAVTEAWPVIIDQAVGVQLRKWQALASMAGRGKRGREIIGGKNSLQEDRRVQCWIYRSRSGVIGGR